MKVTFKTGLASVFVETPFCPHTVVKLAIVSCIVLNFMFFGDSLRTRFDTRFNDQSCSNTAAYLRENTYMSNKQVKDMNMCQLMEDVLKRCHWSLRTKSR